MYGLTRSGKPIDDEMIEQFVEEAEAGYNAGQLKGRRGSGSPLDTQLLEDEITN